MIESTETSAETSFTVNVVTEVSIACPSFTVNVTENVPTDAYV